MIADRLNGLDSPDEAVFYTSGRTSNEAAFAYQLFVRAFGTNNMPDCSNMCHESTSVALAEVIGIGKGSVSLEDIHTAELIVVIGQNPGTNHPRMLTALETAKKNGAKILAINPLKEAGFVRFRNPQNARGLSGVGTELADLHLPIRVNGDLALFQAIGSLLLQWGCVDEDFVKEHTVGYDAWAAHMAEVDWVGRREGHRARPRADRGGRRHVPRLLRHRALLGDGHHPAPQRGGHHQGVHQRRPAAGQHRQARRRAVPGPRPLQRPGRPHDGHLGAAAAALPRRASRRSSASTRRARTASTRWPPSGRCSDGKAKVFFALGGNFVAAAPDTHVTEDAMRRADLTVQVSTKLNRSHVVPGQEALILPTMGRTEKDHTGGKVQRVTVEDSMSAVHASHGPLKPASKHLRSEVDIVCTMAEAVLGDRHDIPWHEFRADYTAIRRRIANVVPGCAAYDEKVDQPGGFVLPHPPRDSRTFPTEPGRAVFTVSPIDVLHVPEGRLLMQTLRSHDQFNTTIYGLDDRYRGVSGGRRVVFVHPDDIAALGPGRGPGRRPGQRVDRRLGAARPGVPDRALRPAPGLRRVVLPRDQPAGPARLHRRRQQLPDVEVDHRPARAGVRGRWRQRRRPEATGGSTDAKSDVEPAPAELTAARASCALRPTHGQPVSRATVRRRGVR